MIQMTRALAMLYRRAIVEGAKILTDEDALKTPLLFPRWDGNGVELQAGTRVYYDVDGLLYTVLQTHITQPAWTPDAAPSLFARVLIPGGDIPEWVQPDSTNPYMKGDKVRHNDKTWESDYDNNVWEPGVFGWHEVEQ